MCVAIGGWIVGTLAGAAITGGVLTEVDSGSSKYSDHSSYSDYNERKKELEQENKKEEFDKSKEDLKKYVNNQIEKMIDNNELDNIKANFDVDESEFESFDDDFKNFDEGIQKQIKKNLNKEIEANIKEDVRIIKDIDELILKINKINLTSRNKQSDSANKKQK